MDAVDMNDSEWTGAAFGVCAWVLKGMPKLELVAGLSKATIFEKRASPYLKSIRQSNRLSAPVITLIW